MLTSIHSYSIQVEALSKRPREETSEVQRRSLKMRRRQKGFSLIELLIVVAIILIIAAIAIPNLLRSRMAANESSAVGSPRPTQRLVSRRCRLSAARSQPAQRPLAQRRRALA